MLQLLFRNLCSKAEEVGVTLTSKFKYPTQAIPCGQQGLQNSRSTAIKMKIPSLVLFLNIWATVCTFQY